MHPDQLGTGLLIDGFVEADNLLESTWEAVLLCQDVPLLEKALQDGVSTWIGVRFAWRRSSLGADVRVDLGLVIGDDGKRLAEVVAL